jgi:hypothetical protein
MPPIPIRPHFVNAQEMHEENPDTFEVPSEEELAALHAGNTIKVSNGRERFWIEIVEKRTRGYFIGIVMNKLLFYTNYTLGDLVQFHKRHIYSIASPALLNNH